jgi:hypothetical protein
MVHRWWPILEKIWWQSHSNMTSTNAQDWYSSEIKEKRKPMPMGMDNQKMRI